MNLNCTECRWHEENVEKEIKKCPECGGKVEVVAYKKEK